MLNPETPNSITLLDRIAGACLAFFSVFVTLSFLSIIFIGGLLMPKVRLARDLISLALISPFFWVCAVSLIAAIWGAYLGSLGVIVNLGHLWGTETPPNQKLTDNMRLAVGIAALPAFIAAIFLVNQFH